MSKKEKQLERYKYYLRLFMFFFSCITIGVAFWIYGSGWNLFIAIGASLVVFGILFSLIVIGYLFQPELD